MRELQVTSDSHFLSLSPYFKDHKICLRALGKVFKNHSWLLSFWSNRLCSAASVWTFLWQRKRYSWLNPIPQSSQMYSRKFMHFSIWYFKVFWIKCLKIEKKFFGGTFVSLLIFWKFWPQLGQMWALQVGSVLYLGSES